MATSGLKWKDRHKLSSRELGGLAKLDGFVARPQSWSNGPHRGRAGGEHIGSRFQ